MKQGETKGKATSPHGEERPRSNKGIPKERRDQGAIKESLRRGETNGNLLNLQNKADLGQALSTRPDILPTAYCQELAKLQDQIPPFSTRVAINSIESQLGVPISQIFADISSEPIAAASLGQVYKAHLHSGELVAVKVQRPGMSVSLTLDALLFQMIGGQLKRFAKARKDLLVAVNEMVVVLMDVIVQLPIHLHQVAITSDLEKLRKVSGYRMIEQPEASYLRYLVDIHKKPFFLRLALSPSRGNFSGSIDDIDTSDDIDPDLDTELKPLTMINALTMDIMPEIDQFYITLQFVLAKAMSPCIIWISNIHDLDVDESNYFFLSLLEGFLFHNNESTFPLFHILGDFAWKRKCSILMDSDTVALTNEALSISITQKKSIVDTNRTDLIDKLGICDSKFYIYMKKKSCNEVGPNEKNGITSYGLFENDSNLVYSLLEVEGVLVGFSQTKNDYSQFDNDRSVVPHLVTVIISSQLHNANDVYTAAYAPP
ncbi:hypothetical protein RJ639_035466 [Escallonia herrerae]|uniref:ABC1 atypical kinase-like domain-containing protein n=1 Tax=Escallonia herrerae TaxID=1293975 RepID=A0AA88WV12_9ASTE|nr:hypothetical protein RJ639_035466 [Escallonia herrerae]